ncbi:uncharacterized protein LOC122645104 [Telopea speciosissima]|uniref:uncharacterized protein LOC122645104 n=1 Tax=Telopea speciosissima TaxID=54955 RepID=UPI001CC6D209|nr:uncharacterized protein LOC122645104 [Telopea speciosissima]
MAAVTFSINNNMVTIEILTGSNFKKWKEDIMLAIEMTDEKSNRICTLSIKRSFQDHLKSDLPDQCTARELLDAISKRYKVSSNAEIETLLQGLFNMEYYGSGSVRNNIIRMVDYQTKLKALNIPLLDALIVHQALNTLPFEFGIIQTNYIS